MRLIDADALSNELKANNEPNIAELVLQLLALTVDAAPTLEAEPVKRGRWIDGAVSFGAKPGTFRVCSHCNICFPRNDNMVPPKYWRACPNCMTKMDLEDKDG